MEPSLKPKLRNGWIVVQSKTYKDRVYYFNERTNTATWNLEDIPDFQVKRPSSVSSEGSSACSSKMGTNGGLPPGLPKHLQVGASGADECSEDPDRKCKVMPPACASQISTKRKWSMSSEDNAANLNTSQIKPRKVALKRPKFAEKGTYSSASTDSGRSTLSSDTSLLKTSRNIPPATSAVSTSTSSVEDTMPVHPAEFGSAENDSSEAMEVDEIDDEEMLIDIQEVREKLKVNPHVICGELTSLTANSSRTPLPSHPVPNIIYIVVDTNVFLSDMKMLGTLHLEFKDFPFVLKFIVPWVVLQELDAFKDENYYKNKKPSLSRRAQLAIKFVHSQLSAFGESRFQGQTLAEAVTEKISTADSNDDRILQCCLAYAKKSPVLLFTNDINLRNKAIVNNVSAKGRDDIVEGISLLISKLPINVPMNSRESKCVQLSRQIAQEAEKGEQIKNQLAGILLRVFSTILETEMICVYGKLWGRIVYKKPPWTIETVLMCYEKHWIAVFGFFLKKQSQEDIIQLKKFFFKKSGSRIPLMHLTTIINVSIRLLGCCQLKSDFDGAISKALDMLTKLYAECDEMHTNVTSSVSDVQSSCSAKLAGLIDRNLQPDRLSLDSCSVAFQSPCNPSQHLESSSSRTVHIANTPPLPPHVSKPVPAHELPPPELCLPAADVHSNHESPVCTLTGKSRKEIKTMINLVWSNSIRFCGMLCDSFGHPHNLLYNKPDVTPSPDECSNFLPRFFPVVCRLTKDLRGVLEIASNDPNFSQNCGFLYSTMVNFNESLDLQDDKSFDVISVDAFCAYCQIEANRKELRDELWKMVELRAHLQHLVEIAKKQSNL